MFFHKLLFLLGLCLCSSFPLYSLIRGDLTKVIAVLPGEEVLMKIVLENDQDEQLTIQLKQSDYTYNAKGENFFLDPGSLPRSNASWIELPKSRVNIPSKQSVDLFYTIKVPENLPQNGSYWSLILAEPENRSEPQSPSTSPIQLYVKVRYAYQVVANVGKGKTNVKIVNKKLSSHPKGLLFTFEVENHGEVFVMPKAAFRLYRSQGDFVHVFELPVQKIVPQASVGYRLELNDLNQDSYLGLLLIECNEEMQIGEKIEINPRMIEKIPEPG